MSRIRLVREYPNINGFPVPPHELEFPPTALNVENRHNWNNHHGFWTARNFGRLALTQTIRDLSTFQYPMPRDTHAILHDRYEPAPMPDLADMMDVVEEAYSNQIPLRYGSVNDPTYKLIDYDLWRTITHEYGELAA